MSSPTNVFGDYVVSREVASKRHLEHLRAVTISTAYTVDRYDEKYLYFSASSSNNTVTLPTASALPSTYEVWIINSASSPTNLLVNDNVGTLLATILPGDSANIFLLMTGTAAGVWKVAFSLNQSTTSAINAAVSQAQTYTNTQVASGVTSAVAQAATYTDTQVATGIISAVAQSKTYTDAQVSAAISTSTSQSQAYINNLVQNGVSIGPSGSGTYMNGLFSSFTPSTPVGTAVDDFNQILKALAPSPAPGFSAISMTNVGVSGKLSFGPTAPVSGYTNVGTQAGNSALDINATYQVLGNRQGIFSAAATMSGTLASNVSQGQGTPVPAYSANAFGSADAGSLVLEVNGNDIVTVNLATFPSGTSFTNGSGFSLSATTTISFPSGSPLAGFNYRTGGWTVAPAAQRSGFNYMRVRHVGTWGTRASNYFEWAVDSDAVATAYSGFTISSIAMSGTSYLSGVKYHTSGSAVYAGTASNVYRDTYSLSTSAVTHSTTNSSLSSTSLPSMVTNTDTLSLNKIMTIFPPGGRLLGNDISANTSIARIITANQATSPTSIGGYKLLVDTNIVSNPASALNEPFNEEGYRQQSNVSLVSAGYTASPGTGPAPWDSTLNVVTGPTGYNDGLILVNSQLIYPSQVQLQNGVANGRFDQVTNGPPSNPDYSTASGTRTYIRYFYSNTTSQNFIFNVAASSTSFVAASGRTSLTGNNVTMEILAPNTTRDGSNTVVWKDMVTSYTVDLAIGSYASTYGSSIPSNWGVTLGTKSTATSGNAIIIRITASSNWSGFIDNIGVSFL